MVIALGVLAGLAALVAALLAAPLVLGVEAERREAMTLSWHVRGLFGLLDIGSGDGARRAPRPPASAEQPPARRRNRRSGARMALAVLRTRGLAGRAVRTAYALVSRIKVHEFRLHTAFGFDNPADTGIAYGYLSPMLVAASVGGLDVRCQPVFSEATLQGTARASIRVRPLSVIGVLVGFVLSGPALRAMVAAWRARK
jgi:hypothetical protein